MIGLDILKIRHIHKATLPEVLHLLLGILQALKEEVDIKKEMDDKEGEIVLRISLHAFDRL